MSPPSDTRDIRALIPEVRRAIDGPTATGSASVATSLNDTEMVGLIADATATLILNTNGFFPYSLVVTHRDAGYLAPDEWIVDPELRGDARRAITYQAAIDFFFDKVKDLKVSEEISDEGATWQYQMSASLVRDQLKLLADQRDRAITALIQMGAPLDSYISLVAERDKLAAIWVEPWVEEIGAVVPYAGQGGAGGGGYDPRFGTYG